MLRYRVRLLIGFELKDLEETDSEKAGLSLFNAYKEELLKRDIKAPYTLLLVDYKTDTYLKEFTKYPEERKN